MRLSETLAFFEFIETEVEAMMGRWRVHRDEMFGRADRHLDLSPYLSVFCVSLFSASVSVSVFAPASVPVSVRLASRS